MDTKTLVYLVEGSVFNVAISSSGGLAAGEKDRDTLP